MAKTRKEFQMAAAAVFSELGPAIDQRFLSKTRCEELLGVEHTHADYSLKIGYLKQSVEALYEIKTGRHVWVVQFQHGIKILTSKESAAVAHRQYDTHQASMARVHNKAYLCVDEADLSDHELKLFKEQQYLNARKLHHMSEIDVNSGRSHVGPKLVFDEEILAELEGPDDSPADPPADSSGNQADTHE